MKVLLLAAGRSKRVKPIEDKNFLKFAGRTLIEHQLDTLKRVGLTDIMIVGGAHNLAELKAIAKPFKAVVLEQKNLDEGMAGAVLTAKGKIKNEPTLIFSSNDVLAQSAFEKIMKASKSKADAYLLAYKVAKYFPGGYLKMKGNKVIDIIEKPGAGKEPSKWVNIVVHCFKEPEELFKALEKSTTKKDDRYELALQTLMKTLHFEAVPYDGFWQPVKHPWHILDLMQFFFNAHSASLRAWGSHIHPTAQIAKTAVIGKDVVIEAGVKIFEHATVQGPAYIGKNCIIGNNALVRESMLGERCVVGYNTEVARSFVGDDCWFHTNYVGDTVMGNDVSFGAGAICANLRLDEKEITSGNENSGRTKLGPILGDHIRVGVNTSLMPGVRIGSNTMITSGLTVAENIEPGSFVIGKTELIVKKNKTVPEASARDKMKKLI
ncbi:MAG: N-acetylglucosamine-1-phosphate uridyltransferase [Candidatus Peregrinibacteria bacterium GW2011_GWA2_47_7]|nr:MAG: N-acetylglucosamine-1-phosphate uridyltransferase [Candidatus Peregrinibacteria bacterium GW2011_GWA2_47_7]